jgi:hypothetical protein
MKYAILIFDEPKLAEGAGPSLMEEYDTFANGLVERGLMRGGEQLAPATTATVLREGGGEVMLSDGPFAETKEQLGGFFLIECDSLDEALEAARQVPSLRIGGAVEVRPILGDNQEHH